jgi:hypothetical protein
MRKIDRPMTRLAQLWIVCIAAGFASVVIIAFLLAVVLR